MGILFRRIALGGCVFLFLAASACSRLSLIGPPRWRAERLVVMGDLSAPECALPSADMGLFISNAGPAAQGARANSGTGYIGLYELDGMVRKPRWLENSPATPIRAPRGMAILNGFLYFCDTTRLMRCPLDRKGPIEEVTLPAKGVNLDDVAVDDSAVYVSERGNEGAAPAVYRCKPGGAEAAAIKAPSGVEGITVVGATVYAVSGNRTRFTNLTRAVRGTEGVGIGRTFQKTDGNRGPARWYASGDGSWSRGGVRSDARPRKVYTVAELHAPADPGIFESPDLLYVPQTELNQTTLFRLFLK
jgi:hypothetical protein